MTRALSPETAALRRAKQGALFADAALGVRLLPVIGEQKDISYYGSVARGVLNGPEVTGMGFWSINPYVGCAFGCAYCYARYAHRYVIERAATANPEHDGLRRDLETMPPWLAFERRIFVKENAADVLRRVLRHGSDRHLALLGKESIVIGTATDPYQPAERRFRVTRRVLEVLAEHAGLSIVIITKSPLVTRDIDLLRRLARDSEITIHLSLITLDRTLARRLEPRAPTPEARVRALARLREHGIAVGINVMPVLPGITDAPEELERLVRTVAERGATCVNACALRLQSAARQRYLPFIEQEFPELAARYRATYAQSASVGERYAAGLREYFERTCARYGVPFGYRGNGGAEDAGADPRRVVARQLAEQLALL
ncbi:MAG TPA: radical SAM protein [Gemmatimonadaceae bacterium]|jgi:DNA repair photolyase